MAAEIPGYEELQDAVAAATRDLAPAPSSSSAPAPARRRSASSHSTRARLDGHRRERGDARPRARAPAAAPTCASRVSRIRCRTARSTSSSPRSRCTTSTATAKRDLFARVARVTGAFVLGDVVVPERPEDAVIEIDGVYDVPSSVAEQLAWLREAGFEAEATAVRADLAVLRCRRP